MDEDHFGFIRDTWIEIDGDLTRALRLLRHLQPYALARHSLEIGGESPKLVALERRCVMKPHDQRGVNLIEHPAEAVSDEGHQV